MKVLSFEVLGPKLIIPMKYDDSRGFFLETFRESDYIQELGVHFVQDNLSYSRYGTIRGLHYQKEPYSQAKLVRCVFGEILDVIVDIRPNSSTYGQHVRVVLNTQNQNQLFVPAGFAHGFAVLSPEAIVEYKCDQYYHPESDAGIVYNDPFLGVDWGVSPEDCIVSDKDAQLPLFTNNKLHLE